MLVTNCIFVGVILAIFVFAWAYSAHLTRCNKRATAEWRAARNKVKEDELEYRKQFPANDWGNLGVLSHHTKNKL